MLKSIKQVENKEHILPPKTLQDKDGARDYADNVAHLY